MLFRSTITWMGGTSYLRDVAVPTMTEAAAEAGRPNPRFVAMVPVLLSNTVTFAYMTLKGIGLNINTLPVAALGIGLGVDYSIYVVDSIKENFAKSGDLKQAILRAAQTAGRGVVVTSTPLIACTALWYFFSSLRFQAEMAILIALWMAVSAGSALLLMPAMTYTFKPRFIVGTSHASQD